MYTLKATFSIVHTTCKGWITNDVTPNYIAATILARVQAKKHKVRLGSEAEKQSFHEVTQLPRARDRRADKDLQVSSSAAVTQKSSQKQRKACPFTSIFLNRAGKALAEFSRWHSFYTILHAFLPFLLTKPPLSVLDDHHSAPAAFMLRTGKALAEPLRRHPIDSLATQLGVDAATCPGSTISGSGHLRDWAWTYIGAAYH
ncbi:hypothetical protein MBLNU13_g01199t1 [Cladosporium sp. NU13]